MALGYCEGLNHKIRTERGRFDLYTSQDQCYRRTGYVHERLLDLPFVEDPNDFNCIPMDLKCIGSPGLKPET